jgi:hypothetical protein
MHEDRNDLLSMANLEIVLNSCLVFYRFGWVAHST